MLCPECMGTLVGDGSESARCTLCGASYSILFNDDEHASSNYASITAAGVISATSSTGLMCQQHPDVQAVYRCNKCSAPICATCEFEFAGGIHLCPTCATKPKPEFSDKRKKMVWWSLGLAIWSSLVFIPLILGLFFGGPTGADAFGALLGLFVLIPLIVGTGLGVASIDRRLTNPPIVWVAAIWNGAFLAALLIFIVFGSVASIFAR